MNHLKTYESITRLKRVQNFVLLTEKPKPKFKKDDIVTFISMIVLGLPNESIRDNAMIIISEPQWRHDVEEYAYHIEYLFNKNDQTPQFWTTESTIRELTEDEKIKIDAQKYNL